MTQRKERSDPRTSEDGRRWKGIVFGRGEAPKTPPPPAQRVRREPVPASSATAGQTDS